MKEDSMTDRDVCISIGKIEGDTQVTPAGVKKKRNV